MKDKYIEMVISISGYIALCYTVIWGIFSYFKMKAHENPFKRMLWEQQFEAKALNIYVKLCRKFPFVNKWIEEENNGSTTGPCKGA